MFYPVIREEGKVFTVEVQLDITLDSDGNPVELRAFGSESESVDSYITVTPPIEAGDSFGSILPDFLEPELYVGTPSRQLYYQSTGLLPSDWSVEKVIDYYREAIPRLVALLDSTEQDTFFSDGTPTP